MLKELDGKVWEWIVSSDDLVNLKQKHIVSGTIRRSDGVEVRVVSADQPEAEARSVNPNLEDAYLYFIGGARMNQARVIYHLARADFLERVRRYSFLIMLGAVVFLGYQTGIGNVALELGQYRGEYNSAWVGAMMSLIATFFLGWFGFYLVKGSVSRDRETGVGQIMATTPLTRPLYTLGKWLSNFTLLMTMVLVLALAGIAIQLLQGENLQIDLASFLSPFLFVVVPVMALVAAVAVLFETISFLSGGFGNILYFFAFVMIFPLIDQAHPPEPGARAFGSWHLYDRHAGRGAQSLSRL